MELLKSYASRVGQQLGQLSVTQKMLAACLVVIIVMTVLYSGQFAMQPEMVPVLDQAFAQDDVARVTAQLVSRNINYKVQGDRILIPAERRFEVLADLGYSQLLPRDTKSGFDEIAKQMNPFMPDSTNRVMWNRAKELSLAAVIRNFPNVANAVVIIDPTNEHRIGQPVQPTATVNITMRNGIKPGRQLINAAADVLVGSQASLARGRITVIADGVSYPVREQEDGMMASSDMIELRQTNERYYSDKISDMLRFIPGVMVSVHVDVNMQKKQAVAHRFDPQVLQKESKVTSETEESNSSQPPSQEPGAMSNVGMVAGGAQASGNSTTSERNVTEFQNFAGETTETTFTPAGTAVVTAASVRVPRGYFVGAYKAANPSDNAEPDEAKLQPLVSKELGKIRADVRACTGLTKDDAITVETYLDSITMVANGAASPQTPATAGIPVLITTNARQIAIGALAVAAMFMVMMMVRKSAPPQVKMPEPKVVEPPRQLDGAEALVGEATEGPQPLDGMEVEEGTIKAQQMLKQVQSLIEDNPDAAASLVKRWLSQSENGW